MLLNRPFWWTLAVFCLVLGIIPWAVLRIPYWIVKYSERVSSWFLSPHQVCREVLHGRSIYNVEQVQPPSKRKLRVVYGPGLPGRRR